MVVCVHHVPVRPPAPPGSSPPTSALSLCTPCTHEEAALSHTCITSLHFLVLPPLLKSIISGIYQLILPRDETGGFEAMCLGLRV